MLHLNKTNTKQINLTKISSSSCDNLVHAKSFQADTKYSHYNSVYSFNQCSNNNNNHNNNTTNSSTSSITPAYLERQKSLLRKSSQLNRFKYRKAHEFEDNRRAFSKFQEEFIRSRFNSKLNDDPLDTLLKDKESEEALSQFKKKLEFSNLTLVPAADLHHHHNNHCHHHNNNSSDRKQFVNKYCIVSRHGTIRGTLNHVKDSIRILFKTPRVTNPVLNVSLNTSNCKLSKSNDSNPNQPASQSSKENQKLDDKYVSFCNLLARDYEREEYQKIVIYTTSLQVVRQAYDKCKRVKKILQSHCVKYEERDLYKKKEYQQELQFRLNLSQVDLPHIFFNGKYIGNCDQIESFSDQGLLKKLFNDLEKIKLKIFCEKCAGYRFILCTLCNGGKKKHNNFTSLKCTHCNEDGLIRCDFCVEQQLI